MVAHPIITQAIFGPGRDYSTIYGIISAMGKPGGQWLRHLLLGLATPPGSYKGAFGHGSGAGGNQRGLWENLP